MNWLDFLKLSQEKDLRMYLRKEMVLHNVSIFLSSSLSSPKLSRVSMTYSFWDEAEKRCGIVGKIFFYFSI